VIIDDTAYKLQRATKGTSKTKQLQRRAFRCSKLDCGRYEPKVSLLLHCFLQDHKLGGYQMSIFRSQNKIFCNIFYIESTTKKRKVRKYLIFNISKKADVGDVEKKDKGKKRTGTSKNL
jgi:hypothetical protein